LKRVLIHVAGFNLGLIMRGLIGVGTPRGLHGRVAAVLAVLRILMAGAMRGRLPSPTTLVVNLSAAATCTTGC
jgi:hypothetical protein